MAPRLSRAELGDTTVEGDDIDAAVDDRVGSHAGDVAQGRAFDDVAAIGWVDSMVLPRSGGWIRWCCRDRVGGFDGVVAIG